MAMVLALTTGDAWRLLQSQPGPVLVFKHSTTCGRSAAARRLLDTWLEALGPSAPPLGVVAVRECRRLSRQIAEECAVAHASPQVLALRAGRPSGHLGPGAITRAGLDALLARAQAP
jgi:bacillithiol system protein YtxJ